MKVVFLNALRQAAELPLLRTWEPRAFEFLSELPEFLGIGIRLLQTVPEQERVFVLHHPYSAPEFLALMDWADQLNMLFDPDAVGDEVFNCILPDQKHGVVMFAPFISGHVNLGEVMLVTRPLTPERFAEWSLFCDQFASLLLGKIQPDWRHGNGQADGNPAAALDFLLDVHRLGERERPSENLSRLVPAERWFEEDVAYLFRFLSSFQAQFDLDTVFAVQRVGPDQTHVIISSWVERLEDLHPAIVEMLENLLAHEGLPPLASCRTRVFNRGRLPPEHRGRDPWFRSFVCEVDGAHYGQLGVFMHRETDLKGIYRLMALLANHLAFRFDHLYRRRKEETQAELLKEINRTTSNLTALAANVDAAGIIDALADRLPALFGQYCGAILLFRPGTEEIDVDCRFGIPPEGFDPRSALTESGILRESLIAGREFSLPPEDSQSPVRFLFPFCQTSQLPRDPEDAFAPMFLGCLLFYNRPANRPLNDDHLKLLEILLNGVSAALQVALKYQEKLDTIKALEGLIGRLSDQSGDLTEVREALLSEVVEVIRRLLNVNRCSILTLDPDRKHLVIEKSYGLPSEVVNKTKIPLGEEISGVVARTGRSLRIADIESDPQFPKRSLEAYFNRSLLSVPLSRTDSNGVSEVIGVINVNNKASGLTFTEQDQQLLEAIADVVVVASENLRQAESKRQAELFDRQLRDAREVQLALLPRSFEGIPDQLQIFGASQPARQIGGDFYDALPLPDGRWLAAIGDVSGKGMPAAILMAGVRTLLQMVAHETSHPAQILTRVNNLLSKDLDSYHFVTLQLAAIDITTGDVRTASAGHGPLLAIIDGQVREVDGGQGLPLGIHPEEMKFEEGSCRLSPGDLLLFLTDGLTDERNEAGEMFGAERLHCHFVEHRCKTSQQMVSDLFARLDSWRGNNEAHDDRTALVLKYCK